MKTVDELKESSPFPSAWEAIGMTFLIILFLNIFALIAYFSVPLSVPQTALFLGSYTLAMGASILLFRKFRKDKNTITPIRLFQKVNFKIVLLIILATLALNNGITMILTDFIPISESMQENLIASFGNLDVYMLVAMIIGAPIFEEYLFRGMMLNGLLKKHSPVLAIALSSVLFGIMHLNAIQFISATIHGFYIGWIYYKSKNLTYCMLVHFVVNLTGYFFIKRFSVEEMFGRGVVEIYGGKSQTIIIFVLASLVFIGCLWILNQFFDSKEHKLNSE